MEEMRDTFITFTGQVQKTKKDVKVKSFIRNGKVVRAFDRNQEVNIKNEKGELAKKVAIGSLATLGTVLGVGLAGAAVVKLRYNKNLVHVGKDLQAGRIKTEMWKGVDSTGVPLPKAVYVPPTKTNKESLTFFMGGLGKAEDFNSVGLMNDVKKRVSFSTKENNEFIPLLHRYQVKPEGKGGVIDEIKETFSKAVKDGKNQDSIDMAAEIYKWHRLNPTKPINIITHSAGSFTGKDATHILVNAGVDKKLIRLFSTGAPDYGLVDDVVATRRVMNIKDTYNASIPSLHRNTTWARDPFDPSFEFLDAQTKLHEKMGWQLNKEFLSHANPGYYDKKSPVSKVVERELNNFLNLK